MNPTGMFSSAGRALFAALVLLLCGVGAQGQGGYQKAPEAVRKVLDAPPPPRVSISPTRDWMLLVDWVRHPPLADLAQPMLRLAGMRINPATSGRHAPQRYVGLRLKSLPDGKEQRVPLPENAYLGFPLWSPDGRRFAYTHTGPEGIEVWIGQVPQNGGSAASRRVPKLKVNAVYGDSLEWMPDSRTLLVQTVPAGRGRPPAAPLVPAGPTVQESTGKTAPVRTYQDLLQSPHDEELFDHYAASQLALVDTSTLRTTSIGKPGIYASVDPSPDGRHVLVVRNHRPYSYLLPAFAFPKEVEVWDPAGKPVYKLASLPLAEQVPIGGVPTGPRGSHWQATDPATLIWVEALDEGDPKRKVPHRDVVRMLKAPFTGQPVELAKTEHRYSGLTWAEKGGLALLGEFDRDRRWVRTFLVNSEQPAGKPVLVWDRSAQDRYRDPGAPLMRTLRSGRQAMHLSGDSIFLSGEGASPEGDRPFLDRFNLRTLQAERLFRSDPGAYEAVVALTEDDGSRFITRRETVDEPPNYSLRSAGKEDRKALTDFPDPAPQLRGIKKQIVSCKRADGVDLSFTLYLPPDYKTGERLPTVVWAYPQEFGDAGTAGQVSGSPHRFTTIGGISHLFFLTQGYVVLDDAAMPVIGLPETANDTFVEQVVASAKAAIDKAVEMGVTDRERVGVGGHSYGAFMTANLLAHSDLFRAGIARSGAYNRTLTPFGFQSERRTLWEAPEVYLKLSPFLHAHKINEPLLLIHGAADDNPGTFPVQSERLFHAIQGTGGTVRFVSLPHESHGYIARESVEHTLHEMIAWFDRHVKKKQGVQAFGRSGVQAEEMRK
jgi:dipeptidyl aminopeptidase/acylaminoacyl peptidase